MSAPRTYLVGEPRKHPGKCRMDGTDLVRINPLIARTTYDDLRWLSDAIDASYSLIVSDALDFYFCCLDDLNDSR